MARSDFNWIPIGHKFTASDPTFSKNFPVEGNSAPIDDGYILIQVRGVTDNGAAQISIGPAGIPSKMVEVPGVDIPTAPQGSGAWLLWMARIPPNSLWSGMNTITIRRVKNDNFEIGNVVVNWQEP